MNTIEQLVDSIKKSLETKNYYAALGIALTLPDICGRLQNSNETSKIRFKKWFNKYLKSKYENNTTTFLTDTDCYALRCAFLHEANDDITNQHAQSVISKFKFMTLRSHNLLINDILCLDVAHFCNDIVEGVEEWLDEFKDDLTINAQIQKLIRIENQGFNPIPGVRIN